MTPPENSKLVSLMMIMHWPQATDDADVCTLTSDYSPSEWRAEQPLATNGCHGQRANIADSIAAHAHTHGMLAMAMQAAHATARC